MCNYPEQCSLIFTLTNTLCRCKYNVFPIGFSQLKLIKQAIEKLKYEGRGTYLTDEIQGRI